MKLFYKLYQSTKKHLFLIIICIVPAILAVVLFGLFFYSSEQSKKVCTYSFGQQDFGKFKDGITVSCYIPENKLWEMPEDESNYLMGAQYDITLVNQSRYRFVEWSGIISIDDNIKYDITDSWNIIYYLDENNINYTFNVQDYKGTLSNDSCRFGYILESDDVALPQRITITGYFIHQMKDYALFYICIALLALWGICAILFGTLRVWYLRILEKQMRDVQVMNGLLSTYSTVLMIDFKTKEIEVYKFNEKFETMLLEENGKKLYSINIENYVENYIVEDDRAQIKKLYDLDEVKERLKKEGSINLKYQVLYNNSIKYFETEYILLENENYCAVLFRNVDKQQKREMMYREGLRNTAMAAEKANKSKSDFLSQMAHEIRTPMNAIIGMSDIISKGKLDDTQREYIEVIKSSGNALLSMINDILDLSKMEAGKMELVEVEYDPFKLLHDLKLLLSTRALEKNLDINVEIDSELPKALFGDDIKIRQVIINLANNAIKYTQKGWVKLKIEILEKRQEAVKLKISVADSGIGIKDEDIAKLFDAFSQMDLEKNRNIEGTGLGLSIAKRMVDLLGGKIEVSSVYGEGSEFSFVIDQKIASEHITSSADIDFVAPKATVLVVDDNEVNLLVAESIMESFEIKCDKAESGTEALEKLKNGNMYDIIFMDNIMDDMNGIEAAIKIKELDSKASKIPIVALTADISQKNITEFKKVGVEAILLKPISINDLKKVLLANIAEDKIIKNSTYKL